MGIHLYVEQWCSGASTACKHFFFDPVRRTLLFTCCNGVSVLFTSRYGVLITTYVYVFLQPWMGVLHWKQFHSNVSKTVILKGRVHTYLTEKLKEMLNSNCLLSTKILIDAIAERIVKVSSKWKQLHFPFLRDSRHPFGKKYLTSLT